MCNIDGTKIVNLIKNIREQHHDSIEIKNNNFIAITKLIL